MRIIWDSSGCLFYKIATNNIFEQNVRMIPVCVLFKNIFFKTLNRRTKIKPITMFLLMKIRGYLET